jgi:hypothetical protein
MIRFTSRVVGQWVVVLGLAAVGCAGADDAGSSPADAKPGAVASSNETDSSGTCDLRSVDQSCIQYTDTASALATQEETCVGKGGSWSQDPCPAPSSDGGCCSYEGHHACGYTHGAYFDQMDPCFAKDECSCDVGR